MDFGEIYKKHKTKNSQEKYFLYKLNHYFRVKLALSDKCNYKNQYNNTFSKFDLLFRSRFKIVVVEATG